MLISVVLRLSPAALAAGELAGEVEHVQTGERGQFRDGVELGAWCARLLPTAVPPPRHAAVDRSTSIPSPGDLP